MVGDTGVGGVMWQPIETAPKNKWIMGLVDPDDYDFHWDYGASDYDLPPPVMMAVIWHEDDDCWRAYSKDGGYYGAVDVTHWQPLPEPPDAVE